MATIQRSLAWILAACLISGYVADVLRVARPSVRSSFRALQQEEDNMLAQATQSMAGPARRARNRDSSRIRQTTGNDVSEFVNATAAEVNARTSTRAISPTSRSRILDIASDSFDRNGKALENVRDEVDLMTPQTCVFDRANNLDCNVASFFREPSGRCNNLVHKTWGMAGTAFTRVRNAEYEEGFGEVRQTGKTSRVALNSPRAISTAVTSTDVVLDNLGFSMQIMQWGQFLAHEITAIRETDLGAICCADQLFAAENPGITPTNAQLEAARSEIEQLRGEICIGIEQERDPVYGEDVCMTQVRSTAVPLEDCSPSPRQQMNTATHYVDGSAIYGSSTAAHNRLRSKSGGRLKSQMFGGKELPPVNTRLQCDAPPRCPFDAGDRRINTTPNLASTHTLFLRKHNKIADRLSAINPAWDDERLFQEARRIVIAIQQNIHFNEWIQHLLDDRLNKYNLRKVTTNNFRNLYDDELHPGLLNELAAAALRFGHTTVGGRFTVGADFHDLTLQFDNPELVYNAGTGQCLAGLAVDRPWRFDRFFTAPMRDTLFAKNLDIVALNINRGRDHGFGSYVQYRAHYNLAVPTSFNDMRATHPAEVVTALQLVYGNVGDVELYIGGVTENKLPNGYVGPLFAEILGDGFKRLRDGDRFYFEGPGSGFTLEQINSIRQYTYAKLICENGDVNRIARDAFRHSSGSNREVLCSELPDINLNLWADEPTTTKDTMTTTPAQIPPCFWRVVSETECCRGQKRVTWECAGGCQPGSLFCPGDSVATQACSCDYNSWCTSTHCSITTTSPPTTTQPPLTCQWHTVSVSECCKGIKKTTRECRPYPGHPYQQCVPGNRGCEGEAIISTSCDCGYDASCITGLGCNSSYPRTTTTAAPTTERCFGWRCLVDRFVVTQPNCYNGRCAQPVTRTTTTSPPCNNGRCFGYLITRPTV